MQQWGRDTPESDKQWLAITSWAYTWLRLWQQGEVMHTTHGGRTVCHILVREDEQWMERGSIKGRWARFKQRIEY